MSLPPQPPLIDSRALHYFSVLAQHTSLSAAAQVLGLTTPSLSEVITRLETRLAISLLIRSRRGIELTEAGRVLAAQGDEILQSLHDLADNVQIQANEARGFLSIALPSSLGLLLAVPLAETVQSDHPNIRLHITEAMSRRIIGLIEDGEVQMGCVFGPPDPADFVVQPFFTEELFLITAPDNWPGAIGPDGFALEPLSVQDLAGLPLALPRRSYGARTVISQFARQNGVGLNVVMEIDALPHLLEMASRASAYTILPQAAVVEHVAAKRLAMVRLQGGRMERTAYIVRARGRALSRAAREVHAALDYILRERVARYNLSLQVHPRDSEF